MRRWSLLLIAAVIGSGLFAGWRAATKDEGVTDAVRIRQLLEDGRQAVMAKDLNSAIACVSGSYRDSNGLTYDALRASAAHAFRSASGYEVALDAPQIKLQNDRATAVVEVEFVAMTAGIASPPVRFPLELSLSKEHARRWVFFPVTRWQITALDGLPLSRLENGW